MQRHDPDVDAILKSLGMAELSALFAAEDIDASVLHSLQDSDLRDIGLTLGQRKKLLAHLQSTATTPSDPVSQGPLPEPELRRLSVLFCDLVGYTEMTTRIDPDDMRAVLEQYYAAARHAADSFGGHIAGFQGDGVILLFGFPVTHEGNAGRAVGAAHVLLSKLAALRTAAGTMLSARIGIASGRAIVGYPSGSTGAELQMVGPVVNRAARLQTVAQPGMVVVDDATKDQAAASFAFAALPAAQLKGFDEVIAVSQALPLMPVGTKAARQSNPTPKSAHEAEAATLTAAWPPNSDRPVLAVLTGEAGIGKSTLLAQLSNDIGGQGADLLHFACSALASQTPLRPVLDVVAGKLAESSEPPLSALAQLLAPASSDEVAAVGMALGIASLDPWDTTSPQESRRRVLQALGRFLLGKGARLVVIEDVHWADPTTRELLEATALMPAAGGALLVGTSRTVKEPLWSDLPNRMLLALGPLSDSAAEKVLNFHLAGRVLPEKIVQTVLARSDGNPLMIQVQARILQQRSELALGQSFEVPSSIYECLSGQLEGLRKGRRLAAALAVFDAPTELSALANALQASEASLDDAVVELVQAGIVDVAEDARQSLRFRHNLYREVCYERLVKSAREKLHLAAFRVLGETVPGAEEQQPGLMALHAQEGGDHARAAPLAIAAGEKAMQRSALIEAGHFFGRAAEALDRQPKSRQIDSQRLKVLLAQASISRARLGIASDAVGQIGAQVLDLARTLGDTKSELIALNGLYAHALVRADYPKARAWAERLLDTAQSMQDQTFQMIAQRGLGVVLFHTGSFEEAASRLGQALDSYDEARHLPLAHLHGYDHAEICSAFLSFNLWIKGDLAGAAEAGAFSISHSRRIGHMHSLVQALVFQSMLAALKGDPGDSETLAHEAEHIAGKQGFAAMLGVARFFGLLGRLNATERPATAAELVALHARWEEFKQSNPYNYLALAGTLLASICLGAGELAQAEAALAEAEAVQDKSGEVFAKPELLRVRAKVLAAKGNGAASLKLLEAALATATAMRAGAFALRLACDLAEVAPSALAVSQVEKALGALTSTVDCRDVRRAQALLSAPVGA